MTARLPRRDALAVVLSAMAVPAGPAIAKGVQVAHPLRGDDTPRLPDHAAFWSRMPLPFTPAEAWHMLSSSTQAEIGGAVIGMILAQYVHGDGHNEADRFCDDALREAASEVEHDILNRMDDRLWALFPDLYGPHGDHPRWALDTAMVHRLGEGPS